MAVAAAVAAVIVVAEVVVVAAVAVVLDSVANVSHCLVQMVKN
jgi:hypothetical protein